MRVRCFLFLFFVLICSCSSIFAIENYKFRTMSPSGGFYYDGIKAIEQDKDGFVWIMMDYELYRFDGFHYKKYYPYFSAMDSTRKWVFNNMASDSKGNLYVNTDNGLYLFNRISDCFEKVFEKAEVVRIDEQDHLWLRNKSVWSIWNTTTGTLSTPLLDGKPVSYLNPVFCTHNKDLYLFINQKVYRLNYAKNELVFCFSLSNKETNIQFAKAQQGKLWVYVKKEGLYKIDLSTFKIEDQYDFIPDYNNNTLRSVYIDKKGYLWFGTMNGLYIFDPVNRTSRHYTHSETDPFSLPNNSVWTIHEDRQRNVWVGTYSGKLCYVNLEERDAFQTFLPQNSGLNHTPVSAFAEDTHYLWIGTEGGGINRMDKKTGKIDYFNSQNGIAYNNIKSLVSDSKENLWISMFMGGLDFYDSKRHTIENRKNIPQNPNSLLVNNIRKTILESDSGLWIAYQHWKPEISYYSFKDQSFTHSVLDNVEGEYLFDIIKQGDRYVWALSHEKLYRMEITTRSVKVVTPNDSTYLGLYTFCLDDSGNIWIGTIGHGLIKFDPNTSQFISLNDYLHHNVYSIYSICYDNGNIWMGTDNGLYCYDIAQNNFLKFDKGEGTQGQVYYPLAAFKGKSGELYFGGTNGFTIIDTKKISHNKYKPNVIISDFYIDHKSSHPNYSLNDSIMEIDLEYDQINFGFQFSSDNYYMPEKNLFKYRLKGYENRWITTDATNRTAMYSKVPAGTYYFEVYAANNDGVWGDTPIVIKINRKVALWFSWPAYMLYLLLIMGVLYLIYRYYDEKKRLKIQLYLENLEKDKKEQIHQSQLRFFTNISHDFRTPLSLIIAALNKLRRDGLKEYYYSILNGNAQRLLNLVNELMDFRTVENDKMKLELQPLNINHFVRETASDFTDYAKQRNVHFEIRCDAELPAMIYLDKSIIEKIVMNLLNNAFKYTPDNGYVTITTQTGPEEFVSQYKNSYTVGEDLIKSETFKLVISDTGVGVSNESISQIFERFYKVNTVNADSHLGTGIGLALVKSLVLLHKGTISIYSERNKGTDMVVCLPLDSSIFNEADFKPHPNTEQMTPVPSESDSFSPADAEDITNGIGLSNRKKILIAEDHYDLRNLISESLSDEFQVVQAADGLEALRLITEQDFDLIISDIMMPYKDGVSLCNDVKGNMNTSHIPFILLTAKTSLESKIEGVDSGADLYFEKPVDLEYLKLSVQNIFRNHQQLKEFYAKNYYADSSELSSNEQDNKFLKKLVEFIEANLDQSEMDVSLIANELSMSRSKLYTKVKSLTGKSIVEFVLNYRLRKAAKLIIEEDIIMKEVMMRIGIESQPYFTNAFKKMFGETPTSFAATHKKKQ